MPLKAPQQWLQVTDKGLYCQAGDFYIDAFRPVETCVITHGHADHARPNHKTVYATPQTCDIMRIRYGDKCAHQFVGIAYHQSVQLGDATVTLFSAGHILGSAQVLIEAYGKRVLITGDFKRASDPSCAPYEVVPCDVLITEATFGLPIFKHPPIEKPCQQLLDHLNHHQEAVHLVGCYALGKTQRLILVLRALGYHDTIYIHGAMEKLCDYYLTQGFNLGKIEKVTAAHRNQLDGKLVICPPSSMATPWADKLGRHTVHAMASGWMQIKARAKQRGVQLPLVVSDHADWPALIQTIKECQAQTVWVTHGREDALVYQCKAMGLKAKPLTMIGFSEDEEES